MSSNKIADEIYEEVKKRNSKTDITSVPHSDEFVKFVSGSMGVGEDLSKKILKVLIASHKILSIEIVAEDTVREIPRVDGFVISEYNAIRILKNYYQQELVMEYEKQFNKRVLIHQVIKEIFPLLKSLNNTQIGQIANKAIMLAEYERLLEKDFEEYTPEWKEKHLEIELNRANLTQVEKKKKDIKDIPTKRKPVKENISNRAVDSDQYNNYLSRSESYPLQRILQIYGMKFFLQVNMRNYKFSYIAKLVEDGQINNRQDLLLMKEMIQTVKSNIEKDAKIKQYIEDLHTLERVVVHKLYFTGKPPS
jgi:hypothetical protein